jgi:DNA-binding IclR family transcriptional regulator
LKEVAATLIEKSAAEHPEHPLSDRARLLRELDATRRKHLAIDPGEHGIGISAVGIALLDAFGRPVAVSIPVPNHCFNEQREVLAALGSIRSMLLTTE